MQVPDNKTLKEFLLDKVSSELQFPLEIVESVISWSYKDANEAVKTYNEVEISGIGKMMLSQAKLRKRLEALKGMEGNLPTDSIKLTEVQEVISVLKPRIKCQK